MRFSVQRSTQNYRWFELYSRLVRVKSMSNIKTIYLFTGKAQSGKNYIACELNKALTSEHKTVIELSFAYKLKSFISTLFDMPIEEVDKWKLNEQPFTANGTTMREILQRFGTDIMRKHVDKDYWIKFVATRIVNTDYNYYLITDYRFPNELDVIDYIKLYDLYNLTDYNVKVIKVINNSTIKSSRHESELLTDVIDADIIIDNTDHKYKFNIKDFI